MGLQEFKGLNETQKQPTHFVVKTLAKTMVSNDFIRFSPNKTNQTIRVAGCRSHHQEGGSFLSPAGVLKLIGPSGQADTICRLGVNCHLAKGEVVEDRRRHVEDRWVRPI